MAPFCILKSNTSVNYVKWTKEDKKNLICRDVKRVGDLSPGKLLKCFVALCVCVCEEDKKPLNRHWSDFSLKLCQNVVESEASFFPY